jgi:hypothetical protein
MPSSSTITSPRTTSHCWWCTTRVGCPEMSARHAEPIEVSRGPSARTSRRRRRWSETPSRWHEKYTECPNRAHAACRGAARNDGAPDRQPKCGRSRRRPCVRLAGPRSSGHEEWGRDRSRRFRVVAKRQARADRLVAHPKLRRRGPVQARIAKGPRVRRAEGCAFDGDLATTQGDRRTWSHRQLDALPASGSAVSTTSPLAARVTSTPPGRGRPLGSPSSS